MGREEEFSNVVDDYHCLKMSWLSEVVRAGHVLYRTFVYPCVYICASYIVPRQIPFWSIQVTKYGIRVIYKSQFLSTSSLCLTEDQLYPLEEAGKSY